MRLDLEEQDGPVRRAPTDLRRDAIHGVAFRQTYLQAVRCAAISIGIDNFFSVSELLDMGGVDRFYDFP